MKQVLVVVFFQPEVSKGTLSLSPGGGCLF